MPDFSTETSTSKRLRWYLLNGAICTLFLIYFGPFAISLGIAYAYFSLSKKYRYLNFSLSFTLTSLLIMGNRPYFERLMTPFDGWFIAIFLFPIFSVVIQGWIWVARLLKPKSLQEQLEALEKREAIRAEKESIKAAHRKQIPPKKKHICLGAKIKGDDFPDRLGIIDVDGWVFLREDVLDQHMFVLGTTGAGKSETIKRLIFEIFSNTNRHVYLVDGKGDEELAKDIRNLAKGYNRGNAPIFKLGFDNGGAIYNGFQGQPTDIFNRLCALIGTNEAEGDSRYYADINRDILQLICYAPCGPPKNFDELKQRINQNWLLKAYQDNPDELLAIEEIGRKDLQGLLFRIRPLSREFSKFVNEKGFSFESVPCAIFSLRVQSVGDTAKRFLDFLVEDLKDFIGKRQTHPSVLIIDEFGQFSNENITALLSLARSAKLGVILATQDVASLKDEKTKKLVLANTRTKLLMASDYPEDVAQLAGTIFQVESSFQHTEGDVTGLGSARKQHAFRVDMNEAARLKPREAFLIRQRYMVKVRVKRVNDLPSIGT